MSFIEYIYAERLSRKKYRDSLEVLLWSTWVAWFGFYKKCFGGFGDCRKFTSVRSSKPWGKYSGTTLPGCYCPLLSDTSDTAEVPTIWIKPVLLEIEESQSTKFSVNHGLYRRTQTGTWDQPFSGKALQVGSMWYCMPPQDKFFLPSCRQLPLRTCTCIHEHF